MTALDAKMVNFDHVSLLLVDDDPMAIHTLAKALQGLGRQRFATSGLAALQLAREAPPDLILLDAEMPGMSGFEVCEALSADPALSHIPVIFITSHNDEASEEAGLSLGAVDFIAKPVNPDSLYTALIKWLPKTALTTPPPVTQPENPVVPQATSPDLLFDQLRDNPDFDIDFGLHTVRGKHASYLRLLRSFADTHADDAARLRALANEGAFAEAARLAHKLKGVGGTLGLRAIHLGAVALNDHLRDTAANAALSHVLANELADALDRSLSHLDTVLNSGRSTPK